MDTRIGPQTPYEVYCYGCKVTFPVGTARCIHCGRPIGTPAAARGFPNLPGLSLPGIPGGPGDSPHEPQDPTLIAKRLGGATLWVVIAVAVGLARACNGS